MSEIPEKYFNRQYDCYTPFLLGVSWGSSTQFLRASLIPVTNHVGSSGIQIDSGGRQGGSEYSTSWPQILPFNWRGTRAQAEACVQYRFSQFTTTHKYIMYLYIINQYCLACKRHFSCSEFKKTLWIVTINTNVIKQQNNDHAEDRESWQILHFVTHIDHTFYKRFHQKHK